MVDLPVHYRNVSPPRPVKLLLVAEAPPPPAKEANYFYNVSARTHSHGRSRSFFRYVMQAIGLLAAGSTDYSERMLLDRFLADGYFLIDACPVPLVDHADNSLAPGLKRRIMLSHLDSLRRTIEDLDPAKILFIGSTNDEILRKLRLDPRWTDRIALPEPLPFPGNSWQNEFIRRFPDDLRLRAV